MFTPSQLEQMPVKIGQIMSNLEMSIMNDIIRRIKINDEITRSADWQIYRLVQMGQSTESIKQQIQAAMKFSDAEIDNLFTKVIDSGYSWDESLYKAIGQEFLSFADNAPLQQLIQAVMVQTRDEIKNITQTMGFAIEMNGKNLFTPMAEYLQGTLDNAVMEVSTGTFDYEKSINKVITEMTKSGVRMVDYASGHMNRIDVAARRAVMTGVNQVVGRINEDNAGKLGTDSFEISWHGGARPSHQEWQGRVYTMQQMKDICGYGTGPGLCGWNCYHSFSPFIPGISERTYTDEELDQMNAKENEKKSFNGKEYTTYEATQRQRQLETTMRAQRQKIKLLEANGGSEDDILNAKIRNRVTSVEYTKFSEKMGLPQQRQRVYADGLKGVDKGGKLIAKSGKDDIITSGAVSGALNPDSREAFKHAESYYKSVRKMSNDCKSISERTGFDLDFVTQAKEHLFMKKHLLQSGEFEYFYPDYEIAQSWQRLMDPNMQIQSHDLILLQHEQLESELMSKGLTQAEAHSLTERQFNYSKALKERG